jgi:cysteine synthase A
MVQHSGDDVRGLLDTIGGTPLVRLGPTVPEGAAEIWVKVEGANPTGSYKDRMALSVVTAALERGDVDPGDTIVEYTGGSTGTSMAFVCAMLGLHFTAVFSDAFSPSKKQAMEAFGATVLTEPSHGLGITPELAGRMRDHAYALADQPGHYYADQFGSPDVRRGYVPIGSEIAAQLGGDVDVLCAAVGTGGALMGTLDGLHAASVTPSAVAVEPAESPMLSTGVPGSHRVEGVAVFPEPPFLTRSALHGVRAVEQERAFAMCRQLARTEGILGGGSTGLNVAAAIELAVELGPGHRVVTFACDSGLKYLGGEIYS